MAKSQKFIPQKAYGNIKEPCNDLRKHIGNFKSFDQ